MTVGGVLRELRKVADVRLVHLFKGSRLLRSYGGEDMKYLDFPWEAASYPVDSFEWGSEPGELEVDLA